MPKPILALVLLVLMGGWALAQTTVVTSIHPYYDLLRQIAGERAEVVRLLPLGASPHAFHPSPRDVAVVAEADLVVLNGVLDAWLDDLIVASGSAAETVVLLEELDIGSILAGEDRPDGASDLGGEPDPGGDRDRQGGVDPHIWLDPLLMVEAVELLSERLAVLDPEGANLYRANATRLEGEILVLDAELRLLLAPVSGAPFVPFHDAWRYFAAHYDLDLVVEIEPFPGREPSPAYLAEALARIEAAGATAVFNERQLNPRPAEVLAESAGVGLYTLDPLGGVAGVESYQQLLRYNAGVIAVALGGGSDR